MDIDNNKVYETEVDSKPTFCIMYGGFHSVLFALSWDPVVREREHCHVTDLDNNKQSLCPILPKMYQYQSSCSSLPGKYSSFHLRLREPYQRTSYTNYGSVLQGQDCVGPLPCQRLSFFFFHVVCRLVKR